MTLLDLVRGFAMFGLITIGLLFTLVVVELRTNQKAARLVRVKADKKEK